MAKTKDDSLQLPTVDVGEDFENLTVDEALAKVAMILAQTKEEKTLTELDDNEIKLCASLYAVADKTHDKMITSFLMNFLRLRVSHKRQGRKELLEVARSGQQREELRSSRLKQFFGGLTGNR